MRPLASSAEDKVAATTLGQELVVVGGFLADRRSSGRLDVYSPTVTAGAASPRFPVTVDRTIAASDGRRLYVLGGYGAPTRRSSSTGWALAAAAHVPGLRAADLAAIVGHSLYVVSGVAQGGLAQDALAFDRVRRRSSADPRAKAAARSVSSGVTALSGRVFGLAPSRERDKLDAFHDSRCRSAAVG